MKPGVHHYAADEYHADPCPEPALASHIAKLLIEQTPLHAWYAHPRLNPEWTHSEDTKFSLGTVCHNLLLGAGKEYEIIEAKDWRTKDAKAQRDAAHEAGKCAILGHQVERAQRIVEAARTQTAGMDFGKGAPGHAELVVIAEDDGVWLRSMYDWWTEDRRVIYDYKTTEGSASPSAAARVAAQFGYPLQAAFYKRVAALVMPELAGRITFQFVFQEVSPPYALAIYEPSEGDLHVYDRQVTAAVDTWRRCLTRKEWPGYPREPQPMNLPPWAYQGWLEREMLEGESDE